MSQIFTSLSHMPTKNKRRYNQHWQKPKNKTGKDLFISSHSCQITSFLLLDNNFFLSFLNVKCWALKVTTTKLNRLVF